MKKLQRILSLALALCMVLSLMPAAALAEETAADVEWVEETEIPTEAVTEPAAEETTVPTEESSVPAEEVTEPTEESTVPTPAVTEPAEETAASTEETWVEEDSEVQPFEDYTVVYSGFCGKSDSLEPAENLTWELRSNGTLVIGGKGAMQDFAWIFTPPPWNSTGYPHDVIISKIILPEGLTTIGDYAFHSTAITSIDIPSTVVRIGSEAFENTALESVALPKGLKELEYRAFAYNDSLRTVTQWPDMLETIGSYVFKNSTGLTEISLPSYEAPYGEGFLSGCQNLKTAFLPRNMTVLPENFFQGCYALEGIILPEGLTRISEYAFAYCRSLTEIDLEGVTAIEKCAFDGCRSLLEVAVPDTVTEFGFAVFRDCVALKKATLPAATTVIPERTFNNCESLVEFTLPGGVETISDYAFYGCLALPEIKFPDSLKAIGTHAFSRCKALKEIEIPEHEAYVIALGKHVFSDCSALETVTLPRNMTELPNGIFSSCYSLKTIELPPVLEKIGSSAFAWSGLTEITLPDTALDLGTSVFSGCDDLKTVHLPPALTVLPDYAFSSCNSLETIYLPGAVKENGEVPGVGLEEIGEKAFGDCTALREINFPLTLKTLGDKAFFGCDALTEVTVPGHIQNFGGGIFSECEKLETINFPDNMEEIPTSIVSNCKKITEVTLPPNVKTIGGYAFYYTSLPEISLPETVVTIGDYAFYSTALTEVSIPENVVTIGDGAFYIRGLECVSFGENKVLETIGGAAFRSADLTSIDLPDSVTSIGHSAFAYCKKLQEFTVPPLVTKIDNYTFEYCESLKSIILPAGITEIGYDAFNKCTALQDVYYGGGMDDWGKLKPNIGARNDPLLNADIHVGGLKGDGDLSDTISWKLDIRNVLVISGDGSMPDYTQGWEAPWAEYQNLIHMVVIGEGITHIGNYAFENCTALETLELPESLRSIGDYALSNTIVKYIRYHGSIERWADVKIGKGNKPPLDDYQVTSLLVQIYGRSDIEIYEGDQVFGWIRTKPGTTVVYEINGEEHSETGDKATGLLELELTDALTSGAATCEIPVTIKQVGEEKLEYFPLVLNFHITVKPLTVRQKWSISFDRELSFGPGIPIDPVKLEAKLKLGQGTTFNMFREVTGDQQKLWMTSDGRGKGGLSAGLGYGIVGWSTGASYENTDIYGIKLDNYTPGDVEQLKAIGTFFLQEISHNQNDNMLLADLAEKLDRKLAEKLIYEKAGSTKILGNAAAFSAYTDVSLTAFRVNNVPILSGFKLNGGEKTQFTISFREEENNGVWNQRSSYVAEQALYALTAMGCNDQLYQCILSEDIWLDAKFKKDGQSRVPISLEATTLDGTSFAENRYLWGQVRSAEYDRYIFDNQEREGDNQTFLLDELCRNSDAYNQYLFGKKNVLSLQNVQTLADIMVASEIPIQYNRIKRNETLMAKEDELDVEIGAVKVKISGLDQTLYTTYGGFVVDGGIYRNSAPSALVEENANSIKLDLWDFISEAVQSLDKEIAESVETENGDIQTGVTGSNAQVLADPDSGREYVVTLSTVKNEGMEVLSHQVTTLRPKDTAVMSQNITQTAGTAEKRNTVSRAVMLTVTDKATGEKVEDFREDPMTFVIRYTKENLAAAGLSAADLDNGIAMYRYNSDGDYFEYVGGSHDAESMTVTAEITQPGQYVLAVDGSAPSVSALELSDFGATPTITAQFDDLTGLDISRFKFALDGEEKVNGGNIADHYDEATGTFTYTVTEALAEGKHTVTFTLVDTSGNAETYEYSFCVDLTDPVIDDATVTGTGNDGVITQIRARASDENLTAVYAVFSQRMPDGSWSGEVAEPMVQLEDGTWALDYEGTGASVKVYILAADIAGNTAKSGVFPISLAVETLEIPEEYIALKEGQTHDFRVEIAPAELAEKILWSVDDENVITVDETGTVTAKGIGTAYVIATVNDGETTLTARCRIDVTEGMTLDGVQLNTTKATTELFSTDYADLEILLQLPQNYTMAEQADVQDNGIAIDSARFTDEAMAERFDISVLDDRRVQIVPTDEAVESALANAKFVAGKYTGTITVTVQGKEYETDSLTLTVKQTKPKVKATIPGFNSFYAGQSQSIVITGGTVTGIAFDASKTQPNWLTLEDTALTLNETAQKKSASAKAYLLVDTEEWRIPAAVTLSVKNSYKVPGVKLAASSVTVSNLQKAASVELQLLCTNKADALSDLNITDITAPEGYTVENFNAETGTFTLKAANGFKSGKLTLNVTYSGMTKSLSLTVKTQAVKLKLSASKITLNKDLKDTASVAVTVVTGGYAVAEPVLTFDKTKLDVRYVDGTLNVSLQDGAEYGKTYPVTVCAYEGAPAVKLSVAVPKQTAAVKSTIKATGTLDVIREGTAITVKPTYTNVVNVDVDNSAVLKIYSSADKYKTVFAEVKAENGIFVIDNTVISDQTLKYKAQLETALYADRDPVKSSMISLSVKMGAAKLTVMTSDTTLFANDKNDRALVWFEAKDAALNDVSRVEIKDAKYQDKFEVIDYENGQFAIAFKDGVPENLIGKTVTLNLNVFIEGNQTAKANATVKVKLTIVK